MPTWAWIPIGIAIVLVVALIVMAMTSRRTTNQLRQRYGAEYDRTVQARDDRRAAEADLRGRQQERARLDVKPLPESSRQRFAAEWRDLQERFVEQPGNAVMAADGLVSRVMRARGYPVQDFDTQANLISVDHPSVVENYRSAHRIFDRARTQQASTEDLRAALLHYRTLFDELLEPEPGGGATRAPADAGTPSGGAQAGEDEPAAHYRQGAEFEQARASRPRTG